MKNRVYLEPSKLLLNQYYNNLARHITELDMEVHGGKSYWKEKWSEKDKFQYFIFSWLEDSVAEPLFWDATHRFFVVLSKLLILRIKRNKLIWIKHNYRPHKLNNSHFVSRLYYKVLVLVINAMAYKKVAHAIYFCKKEAAFHYLPHPLYINRLNVEEKDIEFLIFGRLFRYKGILSILEHWPKDKALHIVGKPEDSRLLTEIKESIESKKLNVELNAQFIEIEALEKLLNKTQTVIIANENSSMIASGVLMHALSFGCSIISTENQYSQEIKSIGLPISTFKSFEELTRLLENYHPKFTTEDETVLQENFGKKAMKKALNFIFHSH